MDAEVQGLGTRLQNPDPKLKIGRKIGEGPYCAVYEGEWNRKRVAVKKMHRLRLEAQTSEKTQEIFWILQCTLLLKQLSHPRIMKFFVIYKSEEDGPVLAMEWMQHNLEEHLKFYANELSRERQIDFCLQIADAVHYLHSQKPPVVYRDLTRFSVFLSPDGMLKLGSSMAASRMPSCGYFDETPFSLLPYMPPEAVVENAHYNEKIDIFSFGVLMLEIATQRFSSAGWSPGFGIVSEVDRRTKDLSFLLDDHPLKPIILECLRDDPGERPDSGAVLRMLSEACPMLEAAYKETLHKHGSLSVDITQCIFVGAPGVGKSSLKHLLVHNTPKAVKTSTAVVDTPEVVSISSEQYAVEGGTSAWQLVNDDVMRKSLRACINTRAFNDTAQYLSEAEVNKREHAQQEPSPLEQSDTLPQPSQAVPLHQQPHSNFTQSQADMNQGSVAQANPIALLDEQHSRLIQEMGGDGGRIQLKDASFIHLLDTGGQPSFQDTLPLLLDTPCTYIQVFNAAHELDHPVPITYRSDDRTEESLPPSAETGWEMMLRSFSSMQTMSQKCSKELATFWQEKCQLPQLCIFVVGTFRDKLVEEGRLKEVTQDISKCLRELEGKPYYYCIKRAPTGKPFYLIDNMAEKGASVSELRKDLSTSQSSFKLRVPVMWYICKQITQGTAQKFIRFQDLKAFCLKHKFIDANGAEEQFRSFLKLFSLLGFYSFFDLKDVPDEANYVCTSKGVFLKEVSKLLAIQFLQAPKCHAVEVFKQNGIISTDLEIFEELGITAEVDRSWFLAVLEHVGLLACYTTATDCSPSYFMPVALPQGKTKLPEYSSVSSLCATFTFHSPNNPLVYTDLPRGIFCRLAVKLSNGPWTPIPEVSDRTTVKFFSEEFELYLTEAPGFIRLTPVLVEELEGKEPLAELHKLCSEMHNILHRSIITSAENVLGEQFRQTAKIVFGFECGCGRLPHLAMPTSAKGRSLICQATHKRHRSLKKQQIWFSPVGDTELVEVAGCSTWVMEETGGHSSDPPQMGHMRQEVLTQQYPACSKYIEKKQDAMSLRIADIPCFEKLLMKHVAQNVGKQGHSLLILLGLPDAEIQMLCIDNPHNYTNAIHGGLLRFKDRAGTWGELIEAMQEARIGLQYIEALKGELNSIP